MSDGRPLSKATALFRAAHPGPSAAVVAFACAWGAFGVGLDGRTLVLLGAAVATGQLSIGWCNDWADAQRDTVTGRADKPVASGDISRAQVGTAAVGALTACVVLSLALGTAAGLVHLVAVTSGLAYDLGLKSTVASPLPYGVSFGLLPAVATLAASPGGFPSAAVMVASALLGVAAHLANTIADTADDARTGVRGLPQRLGPRVSAMGAGVLVALAAAILLPTAFSAEGTRAILAPVLLLFGVVLGCFGAFRVLTDRSGQGGRSVGRGAFWLVVVSAAAVVLGVITV